MKFISSLISIFYQVVMAAHSPALAVTLPSFPDGTAPKVSFPDALGFTSNGTFVLIVGTGLGGVALLLLGTYVYLSLRK